MQKTPWTHIEYAAGNYGNSLVFGNLFRRSNYEVSHQTLAQLVKQKGSHGVFYVNDLIEEWAQLAATSIHRFAESQGWKQIEVRVLAGDVTQIELPYTDTAHLKNPRIGLIHLDGHNPFFTKLANHSLTGLEITTHYPQIFLDQAKQSGFSVEPLGPGERYRFPSGRRRRLPTEKFLLRSQQPISPKQRLATLESPLGRPWSQYIPPQPNWQKRLQELWHALLVTTGIRRQ